MVDDDSGSGPVEYPHQELLPQDVRPGRNRAPLVIALVAVLVVLAAAGGVYFLLRDDDSGSRAAYCDGLRQLTADGDLDAAMDAVGPEITAQLQAVIDNAPKAIADDWRKVRSLAESAGGDGDIDMSAALGALSSLQAIAADAKDNCDLPIDLPSLGGV